MYRDPWSESGPQSDPDQVWQQQEQRRRRSGQRDERIVPRPAAWWSYAARSFRWTWLSFGF